jgi:hypothetical protein
MGFSGRFTTDEKALPKSRKTNELLFLQKVNPTDMDAIESAYDETFDILEEFVAYMYNHFLYKMECSPFSKFDLSRVSFVSYSAGELCGWILNFEDDKVATNIKTLDKTRWYEVNF